jgi:hypothetical protein
MNENTTTGDHLADLTQAFERMAASQREALGKLDADNEKILRKMSLMVNVQPAQKLKRWVLWSAGGILASIMVVMFFLGMKLEESSANSRVAQANELAQKAVQLAVDKLDAVAGKKAPSSAILVKPLATP